MEETRRPPRERELVLAPNEYAYVLDTTKGHINCYVGPNKTSLAQTDQPVVFNALTKRFDASTEIPDAVQLFATAPANWYMVLKNPARDGHRPKPGVASGLIDLDVGRKVIIPGPASFALWPGQMAKVVEGHRLKSNQYLVIQIYDAKLANENRAAVLGTDVADDGPAFEIGEKRIIKGTDVSFYMPPNGVEVVPDHQEQLVREAVTLQRLEYCVLMSEDGKRSIVRGEAVVFPRPDQQFLEADGRRRLRALELNEITGIHVKVTTPYVDDDGVAHVEGEELFITGKNKIYFPREEHAIVKSGPSDVHHAIAIPAGEGRYVLDRIGGDIKLLRGPLMFLPDPRREVITRRVLSDRESALMFPANETALVYNRTLRKAPAPVATSRGEAPVPVQSNQAGAAQGMDGFARNFVPPRQLVLDTKYDGAVSLDVWSGYAVQVVDKRGNRRVVRGPQTVLLAWDETLEALTLSTGTPKTTQKMLSTAYLQVSGNQVSDRIEIVSSDLVKAAVTLKYRTSFESEPGQEQWFQVDNYVKLLCDHGSSLLKAACRQLPIRVLRAKIEEIVRDALLGKKGDGPRSGMAFVENGMRVTDVDVLDLMVTDEAVATMLDHAQLLAIKSAITVAEKESALGDKRRVEEITRELIAAEHETKNLQTALDGEREGKLHALEEQRLNQRALLLQQKREAELRDAADDGAIKLARLEARNREVEAELAERGRRQQLDIAYMREQVEAAVKQAGAFSPELIAAVTRLGDAQLLSALSANFGELAAVEGKGLLETAKKFLDFVPQTSLPMLKRQQIAEREGDAE